MIARTAFLFALVVTLLGSTAVSAGILDSIKNAVGLGPNKEQIQVQPGSENLPNYFRIETEVVHLENQGGIKSNGGSCTTFGKCDPQVYAYIDTEKPTNSFPGSLDIKAFPRIFEAKSNNNPDIGAKLTKDVCNKDITQQKATLRVHITDHNKILSDSLIDDFDCPVGGTAAKNAESAQWTDAKCSGKNQPKKIILSVRTKIYRISPKDCSNARPAPSTPKSIFG